MLIAKSQDTITTTTTNYSHLDSKAILFRTLKMSTVICTISLKFLTAMIFTAIIIVWIAANKYYEAKEKQRKQNEAYKIATITVIAIFMGQIIWWMLKKLRSQIICDKWIKKEMESKPIRKLAPKQRAASLMSH